MTSETTEQLNQRNERQWSEVDSVDREALERAVAIARRDPERAQQFDDMRAPLYGNTSFDIASLAAYVCQTDALNLKPHESPPMHCEEDDEGPGADILRALLHYGLSLYEPNPAAALRKAKAKTKRQKAKKRK